MKGKAIVRHVRISPRKARSVANLIRGKSVDEAMGILRFIPRKASEILQKVLRSAVANAEQVGNADVDRLFVAEIQVNQGPILKRWLPRAMGRATRMMRHTAHIAVGVEE